MIGIILGFVALLIITSVLNGWALSILWLWFLVPFGLPVLSIPQAIGIAMVVNYLTYQYIKNNDKDWGTALVAALARPFVALGIGYIVTLFL